MLDRIDVKYFKLAVGADRIGVETDIDISARCPVCGDSRKNKRKKRLHLYKKGIITGVNCFNGDCSVHNKTVYSFLSEFYPSLLDSYKREQFGNTMQKLSENNSGDVFAHISTNNERTQEIKIHPVTYHDLTPYFKNISEVPQALKYLEKRGIVYDEQKFGIWYFGFQNLQIGEKIFSLVDSIIIPLYYKGIMYGFYSRNIMNKFFSTYMPEINTGYKVWNWFNIDTIKPVYIYEGIFDCISGGLKNSIALMGSKLPDARLAELSNPVFVLDNDRTGLKNSLQYCKKSFVYVQPDDLCEKDINELMLNHPEINIPDLICSNLFSGISADVRIKSKL